MVDVGPAYSAVRCGAVRLPRAYSPSCACAVRCGVRVWWAVHTTPACACAVRCGVRVWWDEDMAMRWVLLISHFRSRSSASQS